MKVLVEIFKPSGKYYTGGDYESEQLRMFEIFDEVGKMALAGEIPGLAKDSSWTNEPGKADWVLRVTAPTHEHDHPRLIFLFRDEQGNRTLNHPLI